LLERVGRARHVDGTGPITGGRLDHDPNGGGVARARPAVRGKFLFVGDRKLYVRGVTYGTFRPDANGDEFPPPQTVAEDFRSMRANGVNAVRTYSVPPHWLLDEAECHGLRVMVGLAAERYVGYLADGWRPQKIADIVSEGAHACSGHPAVLCFAVANEIPASIVRWFGRGPIERFIARLCDAVRKEDPQALVTYVNYPSTEYLQLPFVDLLAYNLYLESPERLAAYLARLQNIAGERPLVMAEIGLDSLRNGEDAQAASLSTQIGATFAAGCAGAFVYAWTDEWHRGGEDVEDWAFGITRRDRCAKPALAAVRRAFAATPLPRNLEWPRVSVVVCSCNGASTLRDCLDGLLNLDYADYEVIIVNDGSTDATADIAADYPFLLINTGNCGLSSARNTGLRAATGEIVAYIDDDARPDPHWLRYLVSTFMEGDWAAVGGPNLPPPGDGAVADCIANAPGGPIHVLLSDRQAEHVPGCNMAFRRSTLLEFGGFDPRFRTAGDDVDICWRLQASNLEVGFSPAAVVWHHRRRSVRSFLRQQSDYGKAEALLERKWPEKYNRSGQVAWRGRLYGKGITRDVTGTRRWRVYYGSQGSGLFQSIYQPATRGIAGLPLMPEWYLVIGALAALSLLGATWRPLLLAFAPLLAGAVGAVLVQALRSAAGAEFATAPSSRQKALGMRALTALLHALQPAARLHGRLIQGLRPWRCRGEARPRLPIRRTWAFWSTRWRDPQTRLRTLEGLIAAAGAKIVRGGEYDRWDIEIRVGMLISARLQMAVEEHAAGAQLIRLRASPRRPIGAVGIGAFLVALAVAAALDHAPFAALVLASFATALLALLVVESAVIAGTVGHAVEHADETATAIRRCPPTEAGEQVKPGRKPSRRGALSPTGRPDAAGLRLGGGRLVDRMTSPVDAEAE
jgi:GT2 family glycosyltransferase